MLFSYPGCLSGGGDSAGVNTSLSISLFTLSHGRWNHVSILEEYLGFLSSALPSFESELLTGSK